MNRILLTHPERDRDFFFGDDAVRQLGSLATVVVNPTDNRLGDREMLALSPDCKVIVAEWWTGAGAELFAGNLDLLAFVRCGVEIWGVDLDAATREGVLVVRTNPSPIAVPVAEYTIGLMIHLARNFGALHRWVLDGTLRTAFNFAVTRQQHERIFPGFSLNGEILGIVGLGEVGREVARLAKAFGMRVLAADPYCSSEVEGVELVDLEPLLEKARFVSLHAKATHQTRYLIGRNEIRRMRSDAFLVNTARGALVDNRALADALQAGRIAGAGIDVYEDEPDFGDNPLLACENAILTPHVAGLTEWGIRRQSERCIEIVAGILDGEVPQSLANPDVLPDARIHRYADGLR